MYKFGINFAAVYRFYYNAALDDLKTDQTLNSRKIEKEEAVQTWCEMSTFNFENSIADFCSSIRSWISFVYEPGVVLRGWS